MSKLQWYPHDTGIFISSGSDGFLKIWDTNSLTVVEQFKFKNIVNTHSLGRTSTHCLIAGEKVFMSVELLLTEYM